MMPCYRINLFSWSFIPVFSFFNNVSSKGHGKFIFNVVEQTNVFLLTKLRTNVILLHNIHCSILNTIQDTMSN
jgi:hypothetical protein